MNANAPIPYALVDASGKVHMHGMTLDIPEVPGLIGIPSSPPGLDYYWESDTWIKIPDRPEQHHLFDYTTKQWVDPRTLDDLKTAKWAEVKAARSTAEFSGFTWDGSVFDSDALSQSRIQGAIQLASLTPDFSIDWTLADNTVRTLNAADIAAVGVALGTHVATQHSKARELRDVITAAVSATEVMAVNW